MPKRRWPVSTPDAIMRSERQWPKRKPKSNAQLTGLSWLWAACGSSDQVASPPGPWTGDVDHSPDGAPWALPRHERAASPPRCPVANYGMPRRPVAAHPSRSAHRSPATGTAPSASVGVPPSSRGCPAVGPIISRSTILALVEFIFTVIYKFLMGDLDMVFSQNVSFPSHAYSIFCPFSL